MRDANTPAGASPDRLPPALAWGGYALVLMAAPWLWPGSLAQSLLSQIGIAIISCLAYNILLGQGGMLSFGQAVYSGLGAYGAMHALRAVAAGSLALPVSLVPLVGGAVGLACAALLGWVSTRRSGTPLAMITLGMGELVAALALMLPEYFGGESGLSGNRVVGAPVAGISFGPPVELSCLIALYCGVCTAAMYGLTRTPLGRMLQATRDNAERVDFIGYSARAVRYRAFVISGFFAGIAGGLSALHTEIVTPESLGSARSGALLLFVVLGGAGHFAGPIIGAVLMVLAGVLLSAWTPAWLLYLGAGFVLMVMWAPGGLAGLMAVAWQHALGGGGWRWMRRWAPLAACAGLALLGSVALIELLYRLRLADRSGVPLRWFGLSLNASDPGAWLAALAVALAGAGGCWVCRRRWHRKPSPGFGA